jgi:hypothetical protein
LAKVEHLQLNKKVLEKQEKMALEFEHQISETTLQSAQKHTQEIIKNSTTVEKLGKAIQAKDSATKSGRLIEQHAIVMKQHVKEGEEHFNPLLLSQGKIKQQKLQKDSLKKS